MRITFSQAERYGVYALLEQGWGGDETALLQRDALYDALELDKFETLNPNVTKRSDVQIAYELADELVPLLEQLLVVPGQGRALGRLSAAMLRRIRAQRPKPEPEPAT